MRKVYCDRCGTIEIDKEFIFYTRTEFKGAQNFEIEYEVCRVCDKRIQGDLTKIKEEENETKKSETES